MSEELKPCPFCGGEARYNRKQISQGCVLVGYDCEQCGAAAPVFTGPVAIEKSMKISAAKAWNRRTQQPNELLTVDELRKMIGQWVWVESKDVLCPNGWYRVEPQFRETISLAGVDGTIYETSITNGDSAVYRRPPEEGEKG